jgi:hypothetical protein
MQTIVEMIGPSGIGKSTLLKSLSQTAGCPPWLDLPQAGQEELAKSRATPTPWKPADLFLLERKLTNTLAEQFNVLHRYQHLHNRYRRLHFDVLLRENPRNGVFLDDDHICHLFTTELVALGQVEPDLFKEFMTGRAFVFLKLSPIQILKNIRAMPNRGDEGLFELIETSQRFECDLECRQRAGHRLHQCRRRGCDESW